jgi:hypothetical protein
VGYRVSLSQARAALTSLAKKPKPPARKRPGYDAVCELYEVIRDCRKRGYSWKEITEQVQAAGVEISLMGIHTNYKKITRERETGEW